MIEAALKNKLEHNEEILRNIIMKEHNSYKHTIDI